MDAKPRVVFVADGQEITHRQLVSLVAIHESGSMKRAAQQLGISTPVLHKHIRDAEEKTGAGLVFSTSRGTSLTSDGLELIGRHRACELRLKDEPVLRVAGTLVSERCLLRAATALSDEGRACLLTISTDGANLRLMEEMRVDCVLLDDPLCAMERASDRESAEVASDLLLHKDAGRDYARLAFGAQRLGFRQLEQRGAEHRVVREVHDPALLDGSGLSYFVNRSLVRRGLLKADGAREQRWSVHSIVALSCSEHPDLPGFLEEARRAGV